MGWNSGPSGDFKIETLADGTDWGNPEPVRRALRRFLLDGSSSAKEYDDNRTVPLSLRVKAADGNSLADGEVALSALDGRRCELVWTPPDKFSSPAVFVVDYADLRHKMDDLGEIRSSPERFYSLSLSCLPYAVSDEVVTLDALPTGVSVPTVIDDGSSLTGWSTNSGSLYLDGTTSVIRWAPDGLQLPQYVYLIRTGSIDMSTVDYLSVDSYSQQASIVDVEVFAQGKWRVLEQVAAEGMASIFYVPFESFSSMRVKFWYAPGSGREQMVSQVATQATPRTTAARQQLRTITVPGSARTTCEVVVHTDDPTLSTTIVYAGPPYNPDLVHGSIDTRYAEAGTITDTVSVFTEGGGTPTAYRRFHAPASALPRGEYAIWGRYAASYAGTMTINVNLLNGGGSLVDSITLPAVDLAVTNVDLTQFLVRPLAYVSLPHWNVQPDSDWFLEFQVGWSNEAPDAQNMHLDAFWAFNVTAGTLAIVEVGASDTLWLSPSDLTQDAPSVLIGSGPKATAYPASLTDQIRAWSGAIALTPPVTHLYTAQVGGSAEVSATFRPAWHTHPGSVT